MKKKILDYAKEIGCSVSISGKQWPTVAYVDHPKNGKEWSIEQMIKRFTRHTQFQFK